jgi:hypothetical protein
MSGGIALLYTGMYNNILRVSTQEVSLVHEAVAVCILFLLIIVKGPLAASEETSQQNVKKLVFEERRIEGKIRRPQLVLIKAEQRPEFDPMIIQSLGKAGNITGAVNEEILDRSPYEGAFRYRNERIDNYIP